MKKSKKDLLLFIVITAITIFICWNYLTMHYATDTYNVMQQGYEKYAINWSLIDGRVFMAVIRIAS